MPIKTVVGDYFVTNLNEQTYVFLLDGSRIMSYRETLAKSFRVIFYDVSHYRPISDHYKEIELAINVNSLPKINKKLFTVMKILGRTEKEGFQKHNLVKNIEELATKNKLKYSPEVENILNYFTHLSIFEIVTPLKRITDFIEEDLIATDAKFMGSIFSKAVEVDKEHKPVTNKPVTAKKSWMLMLAVIVIVILVAVVGYISYDAGYFDDLGSSFGGSFGGSAGPSSADLMKQYPTPEALKAGVDRGELNYDKLPPDIKKLIDNVKLPVAVAQP